MASNVKSTMEKETKARWFAWWYFAIGAGFFLLGVDRLIVGGRMSLIILRFVVAGGFVLLGYLTMRGLPRRSG